jgi:hypothetical protein
LASVAATLLILAGEARAVENLDAGKSGPRLFSDSCSTCHRSARGLAKGRFRLTLYLFLQQHYVGSSDSASALTSYLQSVDQPLGQPARSANSTHPKKSEHPRSGSGKPPRPPMPVPAHR